MEVRAGALVLRHALSQLRRRLERPDRDEVKKDPGAPPTHPPIHSYSRFDLSYSGPSRHHRIDGSKFQGPVQARLAIPSGSRPSPTIMV